MDNRGSETLPSFDGVGLMENFEDKTVLRFEDWSMANPECTKLHDALWTARYNLNSLTQTQAYLLCEAVESYRHLTAHPTSTKSIIAQLRKVRRLVKEKK